MQVAEIVVRFGGSVLDVRHLGTGTYRIGSGRDVDLAVVGLTSFPIVEWTDRGCTVRVPAGTPASMGGAVIEGTSTLTRGVRVELVVGAVEISIELIERVARVPKRRVDTSSLGWITGALAAHLIALLVIDTLADPEPEGVRVASLVSLLPQVPEPPPPPTTKPQMHVPVKHKKQTILKQPELVAAIEPTSEVEPAPVTNRAKAIAGARKAGILGAPSILGRDTFAAVYGKADLNKELSDVGPIYDEVEAEGKRFGGGRRFDPTKREGWGTVETGRYATVSKGRAVGDHYTLPGEVAARSLPTVAHCVGACTASPEIKVAIARYDEAILGCYERGGGNKRGDVVVEISIGEDGKVVTSDGAGLGTTGSCVAGVIRRIAFPKAAATVRYPLSFSPG